MANKPSILSPPPSPRQLSIRFRKIALNRFRLLAGAAITCLLVIASLSAHRLPDSGLLFLGSENAPAHAAGRPIGYVNDASEKIQKDYGSTEPDRPRVAIASMLYGDNELYKRAINTHLRYAERHGYPAYVLRKELVNGVWNKLAYLIHVLMTEMDKGKDGARWIMWVDADSMVVNPAIPLEIFLPPDDFPDMHFLATKDQNGFNAGMFFIRAHKWSINLLASAMTFEGVHPDVIAGFAEQTALYVKFNETENGYHVLYQPRLWFNTYEWSFAYEGKVGDLFVHFVGLQENRWARMVRWLDILEGPEQELWEVPLSETRYAHEIDEYWSLLRDGKAAVQELSQKPAKPTTLPDGVREIYEHLLEVLWSETDQPDTIRNATRELREATKNVPGFVTAGAS